MRQASAILFALGLSACATTDLGPTWTASSQEDPVTGVTRCVVSVPDSLMGSRYSSSLRLYPFVEQNSDAGLLVGVSSGGKYRVPPGDIVWRIDRNEPHLLTMAGTPRIGPQADSPALGYLTEEQRQQMDAAFKMADGMTSAIQNGVTAVGGKEAEALLAEMRSGSTLLFRARTASPQAGLPSSAAYDVGRVTNGRAEPIVLDASFEAALSQCGL